MAGERWNWSREQEAAWRKWRGSEGNPLVLTPRWWPRKLRARQRLEEELVSAQAILGFNPEGARINGYEDWGSVDTSYSRSRSNVIVSGIKYSRYLGNGGGTDGWTFMGGVNLRYSIEWMWDPNVKPLHSVIVQDMCYMGYNITGGTYDERFFGFLEFNSDTDPDSVVGIGFRASQADNEWYAFVKDGTASPSNSVVSQATGADSTAVHRLAIVLDAKLKQVLWYVDGALAHTWTPTAALSDFGTVTRIGYVMYSDQTGNGQANVLGGSNPRFMSLRPEY